MKKKVILYCRVSSDEQAENTSLDFQEDSLRRYCARNEYEVVAVYREDYSAKHYDLKRPEMRRMYDFCKSNKAQVDKILFLRWDRYSRNVGFAFEYQRKFSNLGIEINAIESPIDFGGTEWPMLLSVYCGAAHTEDNKISKRTKDGIRATLKAGRFPQKAPIGYLNNRVSPSETHLIKDSEYAPIVEEVFRELAKGIDSVEVLRIKYAPLLLRRKGKHNDGRGIVKDTTNHPISKGAFYRMLRNRIYCGEIVVPAYKDEPEQIIQGEHEPIIDKATFNTVQDVLDGRTRCKPKLRKTDKPELFLRRYLVCPYCGYGITGAFSTGNGGKYAYYNCCHCKKVKIRAEKANDAFAEYVGTLKPTPEARELYRLIVNELSQQGKDARKAECDNLQTQLNAIEKKIANADDKYLEGALDIEQYQRICDKCKKDKMQIEDRIAMLRNPQNAQLEPKMKYAYSLIDNLLGYIKNAPVDVRCHLIGSIFPEKIEFDGSAYRTKKLNEVVELIFQNYKELEKEEQGVNCFTSRSVPRAKLITNSFLKDLDVLWDLRFIIPIPIKSGL